MRIYFLSEPVKSLEYIYLIHAGYSRVKQSVKFKPTPNLP
jgi:hypothetical protein